MDVCDISKLVELENLCFDDPWSENMLLEDLKNDNTLYIGAFIDDSILVGYIGIWEIGDTGEITNVAVHPKYRKMGIASMLLEKLIEYCLDDGFKFINLEVREGNVPAINLYSKFGFEKVGLRKNYYKNPTENAVLMTKTLPDERVD
ncbi:MAG: ribosomal protein S18-alanine N-acetyltransferase [Clostridia bacterium]|nr:ribosomal protein S18-alanine N-acetyltransferase [Clostridia bacterium]